MRPERKEGWRKELAQFEERRNDLLSEHEKIQKMLQKTAEFGGHIGAAHGQSERKLSKRNEQPRFEFEKLQMTKGGRLKKKNRTWWIWSQRSGNSEQVKVDEAAMHRS